MTARQESSTCDSSVLVAAIAAWHPRHAVAHGLVDTGVRALPGHVLVETYSVMTRMPTPQRLPSQTAADAISRLRERIISMQASDYAALMRLLAVAGVTGGAVYDAVVAFTAKRHVLPLLTLDARAAATYDVVGVCYQLL
ncbi:MAG TPA: PIN domain-containing protein [Lapillicoccus sp.]